MAMFIITDATGIGSADIDSAQATIDLAIIANDTGFGVGADAGGLQAVTYAQSVNGVVQNRLNTMVNTNFSPNYGGGAANVDTIILAGLKSFILDDGTSMADNGTALPPASSGLPGAGLNTTENCLVIYDTEQNICVARAGTGGVLDLPISNAGVLYHELSHAFRIVNNTLLPLGGGCNPSSPEENAAIIDENDLRTDLANRQGVPAELRDPGIHCGQVGCDGGCCIIATLASKSLSSPQVEYLRHVRDHFVRSTEVGYAFFKRFFYDYYAFSPQACTLMIKHPGLGEHMLAGYIDPLLDFWKLMITRSQQKLDDKALGQLFIEQCQQIECDERLKALKKTELYWSNQDGNTEASDQLIALLLERAWPSPYIQWALIAPVKIYYDMLSLYIDQDNNLELLGTALNKLLDAWTPEIPLCDEWAAFPKSQLLKELEFCEKALLQTHKSKRRFIERIRMAFPNTTAIKSVLCES